MRSALPAPLILILILVLFLPGCPFSPEGKHEKPEDIDTVLPARETAAEAIEFYRLVWHNRLLEAYGEVLHPDFEFFFRNDDAGDFAWVTGDSWGRTEELAMAANMFDPEFQEPGGGDGAHRVDRIDMTFVSQGDRPGQGGSILLVYIVEAFVWFSDTDALRTEARFEFEVIPDSDGRWQILTQWEREVR